ncbi:MAG: tetratricopeptide repeat protein [Chitinophagales bacterium]
MCISILFITSCDNESINKEIFKQYENKNFNKVVELSSNEIDNNDKNYYLYEIRGFSYFYLQEYDKAYEDLIKLQSITKDTTSKEVLKAIAACDFHLNRNEQALQVLNPLVFKYNSDKELLFLRGRIYKTIGDISKSFIDFNHAISIDSNYDVAYNERGLLYRDTKEFNNAKNDFTKYISLDSTTFFAYYNRGVTYLYLKEYNLALADFNKALSLKDTSIAYYNRAITYKFLNQKDKSCEDMYKSRIMGFNRIDSILIKYCINN